MRSTTEVKINRVLAVLATIAIAVFIFRAPIEDGAAFVVAIIGGGGALLLLSLVRDPRERSIVMRLFCGAFVLRIVFTVMAYKAGVTEALGGQDDRVWEVAWINSRFWQGWLVHPPTRRGIPGEAVLPETIWQIYDGSRQQNMGFHYFATYFYYLLNIPSQMALSFVNCIMNSLTVVALYKVSRQFFSEKASLFAAGAALILPGFLAWSALSIKETWVILFELGVFYAVCRFSKEQKMIYVALGLFLVALVLGIRFYVAYVLLAGSLISLVCFRSEKPLRTGLMGMAGVIGLFAMLIVLNIVQLDLQQMVMSQVQEMENFRAGASGRWGSGQGFRTNSAIQLDYDITTPGGAIMMILIGSSYLMLSPFPWQMTNIRQAAALPDVLLWWFLVFGFILPGIVYTWRRNQALVLSIATFTLPLILFYSLIFGNFGLAYRQRAQLMPFLLVLAAAGYERREKLKVRETNKVRLMKFLRTQLQTQPVSVSPSIRS